MTDALPIRVELCIRADGPVPTRRAALTESLKSLEREGRIAEVSVRTWPAQVNTAIADDATVDAVLEAFRTFERWASERGLSVRPPFEERTLHSRITGEHEELLSTPLLCLAVYEGDELRAVYPWHDDDHVVTVSEAIEALASAPAGETERPDPLAGLPGTDRGGDSRSTTVARRG